MEKKFNLPGTQELSFNEALEIRGGETFWYWIAYTVGTFVNGATNNNISRGQRLYNAALG